MIYKFNDRIEIMSYGGLPLGQTREMFFKGVSKPRSESLMRIMRDLGYTERTGHGVPSIINVYGEEAFTIEDDYILVTLPYDEEVLLSNKLMERPDNSLTKVTDKVTDKMSKSMKEIYLLIEKNPNIKILEIMEMLKMSESGVRKNIRQLKERGIIERKGSNKSGYWIIK